MFSETEFIIYVVRFTLCKAYKIDLQLVIVYCGHSFYNIYNDALCFSSVYNCVEYGKGL